MWDGTELPPDEGVSRVPCGAVAALDRVDLSRYMRAGVAPTHSVTEREREIYIHTAELAVL